MTTTAVKADEPYRICFDCLDWHHQALLVLAGQKLPTGCPTCSRSWEALQCRSAHPEQGVRMYLHAIDGIYALLCRQCSDQIERKRRHAYRGTPYGAAKKI